MTLVNKKSGPCNWHGGAIIKNGIRLFVASEMEVLNPAPKNIQKNSMKWNIQAPPAPGARYSAARLSPTHLSHQK